MIKAYYCYSYARPFAAPGTSIPTIRILLHFPSFIQPPLPSTNLLFPSLSRISPYPLLSLRILMPFPPFVTGSAWTALQYGVWSGALVEI